MLLRHNKLNSEKMKKNLNEYRGEVITHLEYIKEKVDANHEHLEKVNGRLRKAENNITAIKTTGTTLAAIIGAFLTWLGLK
jgi:predicted  nucleic acid-binding Zn-ribbon protein